MGAAWPDSNRRTKSLPTELHAARQQFNSAPPPATESGAFCVSARLFHSFCFASIALVMRLSAIASLRPLLSKSICASCISSSLL